MSKKTILLVMILLIGFYAFISGYVKKAILYINVKYKSDISQIEHIENSRYGKPLTLVIGKDREGRNVAIWMNSINGYFTPEIEGEVSLENIISKEKAQQIVIDNRLMDNIKYIQLSYYKNPNDTLKEGELKEGAYWYIRDDDYINVYININTGEYYVYNTKIGEYVNK